MKKKILSVFLILLMATISVSFPVFADDEPEPVIEPVEPEELPISEEMEEEAVGEAEIPGNLDLPVVEEETEEEAEGGEITEEPAAAVRSVPLLGSSGTDAWLSDWDYKVKSRSSYDGDYIFLNRYTGSSPDVTIYGKATVGGSQCPVCINVTYVNDYSPYITGWNCSDGIVNLTFESVDGTKVCSSRSDRLDDLFYGMENLETVHFGGNFQGNVAQAGRMFEGCVNLKSVDIETLDFGYASIYRSMFKGCRSLETITLNCNRGTNLSSLFSGCTSLREASLTGVAGRQNNASDMFLNCTSLETVSFSGMDFSNSPYFDSMFEGCSSLESIDLSGFNFGEAYMMDKMFKGCSSLSSVDLSAASWGTDQVSAADMFYGCRKLEEITLTEGFKPKNCGDMFYTSSLTKLKIKGTPSQEFKDSVFSKLKGWNRYIGAVKLKALIELEDMDIHDCMFSVEKEGEGSSSKVSTFNYASDGNRVELTAFVYAPGSNTFTIEEKYVSEMYGNIPVETIPISETPNITCDDAVRSKTVTIILNTDGSLSVGE